MRNDRFLVSIIIGLAILAIAAIVVVGGRSRQEGYVDDSAPTGVVHNYVLALQLDDAPRAYSYLAATDHKPTLNEFRRLNARSHDPSQAASVRLGETHIDGDDATVELVVLSLRSGIFLVNELTERNDVALLVRQDGIWLLMQMPYEFWTYEWYRQERVPVPLSPP